MLNRSLGLALLSGLIAAGSALAQSTEPKIIGSAADVQGLVTISTGTMATNLVDRSPLADGSRVVTSSTGYVTLKLDHGCDVKLKPNQSVTVRQAPCAALIAGIEALPGQTAAAAAIAGGTTGVVVAGTVSAGAVMAAFGTGALAIVDLPRGNSGGAGGGIPNLPISGE